MTTSTITTKGRLTIPKELRKKYGLKKGTRVVIIESNDGFEVTKLDVNHFLRFAGVLQTKGKVLKGLMREKRERKY